MRRPSPLAGLTLVALLTLGLPALGSAQGQGGDRGKTSRNPEQDLDYAQVVFVQAVRNASGTWGFAVTVRHNDEGWEHYADAWQIVHPDSGKMIAERILAHPHETEQPFTRSLAGIRIPPGTTTVLVRARCERHGFGGREVLVDLERSDGEGFEVLAGPS